MTTGKAMELVARLRLPVSESMFVRRTDMMRALFVERSESADVIASLAEEVERLREALRPFALAASPGDGEGDFDVPNRHPVRLNLDRSTAIDNGDLRRARTLLSENPNG